MTDNDIREQQKEIYFQSREAKHRLVAIKVQAERVGAFLGAVSTALMEDPSRLLSADWRSTSAKHLTTNTSNYSESIFREALNFDAITALAQEFAAQRQQIETLGDQLKRLGIAD
jgi:hypothetical protein